MSRKSPFLSFLLFLALLPSMGCLFRTRPVEDQYSKVPLKESTQQGLIDAINQQAEAIRTLKATVDIDSSAGGIKKGHVTDYKEIRGYILVSKPNMLRMIGLYPIVRNKAFDMVSDGKEFKLSVPGNNKFYIGHNEVKIEDSSSPLDTLRPQAIYDALLLQPVNPENEIAVLESSKEMVVDKQTHKLVQQNNYVLDVIQKTDHGWFLARKVMFDRTNLVPHRQIMFDSHGNPATDANYQVFKDFDGVSFPTYIDIKRPQEEYDIQLIMVKLTINQPLTEEQFALQQPPGSQLVDLDNRNKNASGKTSSTTSTAAESTSPH